MAKDMFLFLQSYSVQRSFSNAHIVIDFVGVTNLIRWLDPSPTLQSLSAVSAILTIGVL